MQALNCTSFSKFGERSNRPYYMFAMVTSCGSDRCSEHFQKYLPVSSMRQSSIKSLALATRGKTMPCTIAIARSSVYRLAMSSLQSLPILVVVHGHGVRFPVPEKDIWMGLSKPGLHLPQITPAVRTARSAAFLCHTGSYL